MFTLAVQQFEMYRRAHPRFVKYDSAATAILW